MKGFRYLGNLVTLKLDQSTCIGCGRCLEVCPHKVFLLAERKASLSDRDACMECGACTLNCPVKAITVDAGGRLCLGDDQQMVTGSQLGKSGRERLLLLRSETSGV